MHSTTIKQRTLTLDFDATKVVVRRMYWKAAKDFLRLFAKHVGGLGTDLNSILTKLPEVIASIDELSTFLVVNSSDLNADGLDRLDLAQAAAVLEAACEVNFGDELKNSFAGIAASLTAVMSARPTTTRHSPASMPSSSIPATTPPTSTAAPSSTSTSGSDTPANS